MLGWGKLGLFLSINVIMFDSLLLRVKVFIRDGRKYSHKVKYLQFNYAHTVS